jgi:uncharacterized protein
VKKWYVSFIIILAAFIGTAVTAEMPVPTKPTDGFVLDQTKTLDSDQITALNIKISNFKQSTGNEIGVAFIPSITNDYLENISLKTARSWGIGQKDKNNGALLFIAKNDRKMRIEVGRGLEGDLTDTRAFTIIDQRIKPHFQKEDYYTGINEGVDGIILALNGKPDAALQQNNFTFSNDMPNWGDIFTFIFFFGAFVISWLGAILGRSKRVWPGGILGIIIGLVVGTFISSGLWVVISAGIAGIIGLIFDYIVSKNYRSSWASGSTPSWWAGGNLGRSGGGFGSFGGGGGFSGGGSSGSW